MKSLGFFTMFFIVINMFSQNETKLQEYLPPSPTAQEFMKYGDYPVGMYTGIPNISIPLYTVKDRDITIPLSLSYHASGIQVDQVASWEGLGWSLNAGGIISKIPRGIPDDASGGFLQSPVLPEYSNLVFDGGFYEDAATGMRDTESDIYYYNVGGYTGKFFFDRSKQIRLIDEAPISITYALGKFTLITKEGIIYKFDETETSQSVTWSQGDPVGNPQPYISSWHLTKIISTNKLSEVNFSYESSGFISTYQYNYSESTGNKPVIEIVSCSMGGGSGPAVVIQNNVHDFGAISSQTQITNSPKRLKEISFNNGKISFERLSDRLDIVPDRLYKIKVYNKEESNYNKIKEFELVHGYFYSSHTVFSPQLNISSARRNRLKLTKLIESDLLNVESKEYIFNYDNTMLPPIETNAKDYWGYYNGKINNSTLIPLQKFQYFGNDVGTADRNADSLYMKAGVLTKIIYPTKGYTEFSYEPHQYISNQNTLINKSKNIFAIGQTGAIGGGIPYEDSVIITPNISGYVIVSIEGSDMISTNGGTFSTITLQKNGISSFLINHSIDPYTYSYPMSPPDIDLTFSPVWLDANVSYTLKVKAVGASSSQEFGGASFMKATINYKEESTVSAPVTKITGGLRIKQIKSFDHTNSLVFSKKYEYQRAKLLTPEPFLKEQYLDVDVELKVSGCNSLCSGKSTTRRFYYGGTVQSLTLNGGSPVVYGKVDEYNIDNFGNDIGKTTYSFNVQTDEFIPVPTSYNGGILAIKKDWMGGQNTIKTIYHKNWLNENGFLTEELNGYTLKKYDESYMMYKIVHKKRTSGCYYSNNSLRYDIIQYPIFQGIKLLSSTQTTTKYESGLELITKKKFYYDNDTHLQPTRTVVTDSKDNQIITKTIYADDVKTASKLQDNTIIEGGTLSTSVFNAVERMKSNDLHQISTPIQIETYKNNGTILALLSIHRTNFDEKFSDVILPESLETSKGTETLEPRLVYHDYDNNGNPLEVSKVDGTHIVYIWGYKEQYPVAKVENATYSQVAATLTSTELTNIKEGTYSDATMRSKLNKIRTSLTDSQVTTYTYEPLVGVTSTTDPRGYTIYYEYDEFNRLKFVKDAEGNIVNKNEYHYKDQ